MPKDTYLVVKIFPKYYNPLYEDKKVVLLLNFIGNSSFSLKFSACSGSGSVLEAHFSLIFIYSSVNESFHLLRMLAMG